MAHKVATDRIHENSIDNYKDSQLNSLKANAISRDTIEKASKSAIIRAITAQNRADQGIFF